MPIIHFLNVLDGDCTIIQHDKIEESTVKHAAGRVSVIDVSNASKDKKLLTPARAKLREYPALPTGKIDFKQKKEPDNPITYLRDYIKIKDIFRFIITHPDMDHLDGIKDFFDSFNISCIWDTDNNKEIPNFRDGAYDKKDWDFYLSIRDKVNAEKTRLTLHAGQYNDFWQQDQLHILAPTPALQKIANDLGDHNDSSYVLLFTPPKKGGGTWKILFCGDSHDKTWEHILNTPSLKQKVANVDILFAPHHGRDSKRDYKFLDTVNPRITVFGNASSNHLAYDSYKKTRAARITNNQTGYMIFDINQDRIALYVKNKEFANNYRNNKGRNWGPPVLNNTLHAYFVFQIT